MRPLLSQNAVLDKKNSLFQCVPEYIKLLSELQEKMRNHFPDASSGISTNFDSASSLQLLQATSAFNKINSEYLQRSYQDVVSCYTAHRREMTSKGEINSKKDASLISPLTQMASIFFLNGDYYKAVVCLMDYVKLAKEDIYAREQLFKWCLFLGEWEVVERLIDETKKKKICKDNDSFLKAAEVYLEYNQQAKNRLTLSQKLHALYNECVESNEATFNAYDLQSLMSWMLATANNVDNVNENLMDPLTAMHNSNLKADAIVKNRYRPLAVFNSDMSTPVNFSSLLEQKENPHIEALKLCSSLAWMWEMRREYFLLQITSAQPRDALASLLCTWRSVLRSAVPFRILQVVNNFGFLRNVTVDKDIENEAELISGIIAELLSPKTNLKGSKDANNEDFCRESVIQSFGNLQLSDAVRSPHRFLLGCNCCVCRSCDSNYNFAGEYFFSRTLCAGFSTESVEEIDKAFEGIRASAAVDQCIALGIIVRPRPPIAVSDNFGMIAVRWLDQKRRRNAKIDDDVSSRMITNSLKATKYVLVRTLGHYVTIKQFARRLLVPVSKDFPWMSPVEKRSRIRMGISCAKDVIRAVSPFGQRSVEKISEVYVNQNSEDVMNVEAAVKEFLSLKHLLHREWRFNICSYVGRSSQQPWMSAMAWAEATAIGTRSGQQQTIGKVGRVTFVSESQFQKQVQRLPEDMSLVQIAIGDDNCVYMVKIHRDREPICVPIAHCSKVEEMMEKLSMMLNEDEKISRNTEGVTPVKFWDTRRAIDSRMKSFLPEIEDNFLGGAAALIIPSGTIASAALPLTEKIRDLTNSKLSLSEAKELVWLSMNVDEQKWKDLVERLCSLRGIAQKRCDMLRDVYQICREKTQRLMGTEDRRRYTFLVICPEMALFPWEKLPLFDSHPYVSRIASIHAFLLLLSSSPEIPRQIDVNKSYYVLDPDNNLGETKKRIFTYMSKFPWKGVVGITPSAEDITEALENMDMFLYFGHGSGTKHMSRKTIKQSKCNAISMLMGCSSVKTLQQGLGFDGRSVVYDYALAQCPLIVGCLWTVTDGEIDRYLMRMVDSCFTRVAGGRKTCEQLRVIAEAMQEARSQCKLQFLTGAAVVSYGLPVVAKESTMSIQVNEVAAEVIPKQMRVTRSRAAAAKQ